MNQGNQPQQAHPAQVAQEFMRRTDMKGGEVEAYAQTFNWLNGFLENKIIATAAEAHQEMLKELEELRAFRREHDAEFAKKEAENSGELPVLQPEVDGLDEVEKVADAEADAARTALEAEGKPTTETADPNILDPAV